LVEHLASDEHQHCHKVVNHNGKLQSLERCEHQVFVEALAFLAELEEHELRVPVHQHEEQEAERVE